MTQRDRAFTLIELLVVLGIVTLLAGLTMPAFKMVRSESNNTGCLSNLRQNFIPWQSYQVANKNLIPMCDFLPVVTPEGIQGGLPNLLSKYMPVDSSSWICPSDEDPESTSTGTSYTYLPGLIRFMPQVQFEVMQVLFALPTTTSQRQREIVGLQTESKLVLQLFENDNKSLFPILLDSADRHPGTRVPRNGVFLDGSTRACKAEATASD